jgi:lysophospholipase L1-like esterase
MPIYDINGNVISSSDNTYRPLSGLKICALGDSNTQYMGEKLNDRVKEMTGCKSVTNLAVAGAVWGAPTNDNTYATGGNAIARVNQLINPFKVSGVADEYDIITLMYGTNSDSAIGTQGNNDVTTTWGAMEYCFDRLLYYYRNAKIGVLLPIQRARGVMTETVEVIKECCEMYSIPYYDMSGQGQIPCDNRMRISLAERGIEIINSTESYGHGYFKDNVHLNEIGKEQYYHKYARFLERLV